MKCKNIAIREEDFNEIEHLRDYESEPNHSVFHRLLEDFKKGKST